MSSKDGFSFPDFSGKCVSFSMEGEDSCNDLNDPEFENQCGRWFVVGTIPVGATTSDWAANRKGAVAWDKVTDYIVFEDVEDFSAATKVAEKNTNGK